MCGIAGILNFYAGAPLPGETIARQMARAMDCGRADRSGHIIRPHIALVKQGHEQHVAPAIAPDQPQADPVSVVFSGTLYNSQEIRAQLLASGNPRSHSGATEIVRAAYLEWGLGCLPKLNGMFAIAIWDARRNELILARDALGLKPLYYYEAPEDVLFGCTPKAIFAHPSARAEVTADGLLEVLAFTKTPGHAIYRKMHEIIPGAAVRFRPGQTTHHRFWALEAREHGDSLEASISSVRELLSRNVARQLSSASAAVQLSGGLDSSLITAMASQVAESWSSSALRTLSANWTGQAQQDLDSQPVTENIEAINVQYLAKLLKTDHVTVPIDVAQLLDEQTRVATVVARDLPTGLGDMDMLNLLWLREVSARCPGSLSGEGADEIFGGYPWFGKSAVEPQRRFPWLDVPSSWQIGDPSATIDLMSPDYVDPSSVENYRTDCYYQAVAECPRLPGESQLERRMREVCYLHITRFMPILADRRDRMGRAAGVEVHVPFSAPDLVGYVFNIPWAMKSHGGHSKALLRSAAAGLLPRSISHPGKSAWRAQQPDHYGRDLRSRLFGLLDSGIAPVAGLLEPKRIGEFRADPQGCEWATVHAVGGLLRLNTWLAHYRVELTG